MCGILYSSAPGVSPERFAAALDRLHHRGPDARGIARHGAVLLGHTRLSIVDLHARSNQPFYSADGRHVIVFNGEIYNFRELARTHGIALRTASDTELLLELYVRHGARMLPWLFGMFAFIIHDTLTGDTFVARDRLGVKPLYQTQRAGGDIFASELAALLALLPATPPVDEFALRQYRQLRGFFNGRTLHAGVSQFPAGHYAVNGRLVRYWDLPRGAQPPPEDDELEALVRSAVEYRCLADVPVGSYLSGGLDSSLVAALSNRTHTWVVGLAEDNEFDWASRVARHLGTTHHAVTVTPEQFRADALALITERREPLAVPNEVLLYAMTREVRRENKVVLSGEGADELFAGYDRIFRWAAAAPVWDHAAFARHYAYVRTPDPDIVADAVEPFLDRGSPAEIVGAFFQIAHLHGLLRRLDNSTMRCGVEGRVPFVDHRFVERLAGVSLGYKLAGGVVKAPLKRVLGRLLPPEVVHRPKVGFPVALDRVLPPGTPGDTAMDRWFNFNLAALGLAHEIPQPLCA